MITRLSNLDMLVDNLCRKPYLFGVRSSQEIFYYILGYCLCENTHGMRANDKVLFNFSRAAESPLKEWEALRGHKSLTLSHYN